jgi:hypothetical protein
MAGGSPGCALAASSVTPFGWRVLLAPTLENGCDLETDLGPPQTNVETSTVRITLAAGLGPGTYEIPVDAGGVPFSVEYSFSSPYYGGFSGAVAGTLTLTTVNATDGLQGSYHFDFGGAGISGGSSNGSAGTNFGSLGELIEDGTFYAPVCDLCTSVPPCGDGGCVSGEICLRNCGGSDGQCIPAPSCTGAASCDCSFDGGNPCGPGTSPQSGTCGSFDGLSLVCGCFP